MHDWTIELSVKIIKYNPKDYEKLESKINFLWMCMKNNWNIHVWCVDEWNRYDKPKKCNEPNF